ncbi:MAG TPA: glycoside hydrolase family 125 protein [Candidatus Eremiobacteraceae bacterium]|nr:glycoside hydrolase family 125 protein [Candidatus Eremiobacteraceae bacterium]
MIPRLGVLALAVVLIVLPFALRSESGNVSSVPSASSAPGAQLPTDDAVLLFHTLQVDFFNEDDRTVYVQTGDIPAMWLRDSAAQAHPYVRFALDAPRIAASIRGVIARNAKNVLIDPHANAFTAGYKVWEEKWEVDSLAYTVRLAWLYWRTTSDRSIFTPRLHWALTHVVNTYGCEQNHDTCSSYRTRFLGNGGAGAPYRYTGMIWGAFRPSDEPVRYPYNIPQQVIAADSLDELAELEIAGYGDRQAAARARTMASQVRAGIMQFGIVRDVGYGALMAYEVDGFGHYELMDDANSPSLLSLPYFSADYAGTILYLRTRGFVLTSANPYYYTGKYASGEGSSHTPTGWVWPLALVMQALTSRDTSETRRLISRIRSTRSSDGLLRESFNPDNPFQYTRSSFGWANAQFAELEFRTYGAFAPQPGSAPTPVLAPPEQSWNFAARVLRAAELMPMDQ